jgi:glycosyltransferase involved in cell wall biosynthesis
VRVALVHDYLTQRGGAERVVLAMQRAFPDAPVYTSLYNPDSTFPEFQGTDIRTLVLDRIGLLRRNHRAALPLLASAFSRLHIDAEVAICSTSGWAHGAQVSGRKVAYCYTPARWLYQPDRYFPRRGLQSIVGASLRPTLLRWDQRAARSVDRFVTSSTAVRDRIAAVYGREAEVLPPPHPADPRAERRAVPGVDPGFFLCVSRLLPYKNVDAVVSAFATLDDERLVVVGAGPERERLEATAGNNVRFIGQTSDEELRWLYAASAGLVSASYEDFGLTPLEAASFGRPTAALRFGGFLDTIEDGRTGVLFDRPGAPEVEKAVRRLQSIQWDASVLEEHAARFNEASFASRLRQIVEETFAAGL